MDLMSIIFVKALVEQATKRRARDGSTRSGDNVRNNTTMVTVKAMYWAKLHFGRIRFIKFPFGKPDTIIYVLKNM